MRELSENDKVIVNDRAQHEDVWDWCIVPGKRVFKRRTASGSIDLGVCIDPGVCYVNFYMAEEEE